MQKLMGFLVVILLSVGPVHASALSDKIDEAVWKRKPILIKVTADWCTYCRSMEKEIYRNPEVQPLLNKFTVIVIDITDQSSEEKAVLKELGNYGPPDLFILNKQGQKVGRIVGQVDKDTFVDKVSPFAGG